MFCLTIAGQPANKIFQMYGEALHIDGYTPAGQGAMARIDERRKCFFLTIAAIRKNHYPQSLRPNGKSPEMAICGFRAVENGVV
jgi:hypothetical protein